MGSRKVRPAVWGLGKDLLIVKSFVPLPFPPPKEPSEQGLGNNHLEVLKRGQDRGNDGSSEVPCSL